MNPEKVTFGPATRKDIETFYGPNCKWTFRACAARLGDETLGVGGIYYEGPHIIAFSSFKPELDKYPVAKVRGIKKIMEIVGDREVYAIASEQYPGSGKLLERLGFEHIGERLYAWHKQHHT